MCRWLLFQVIFTFFHSVTSHPVNFGGRGSVGRWEIGWSWQGTGLEFKARETEVKLRLRCKLRIILCGKMKWFGTGRRANWALPETLWGIWIEACGLLNCDWWVCKGASTWWASMPTSICHWQLNPAKPCCRLVLLYRESFKIVPAFLFLLGILLNNFKLWLFKRIVQCTVFGLNIFSYSGFVHQSIEFHELCRNLPVASAYYIISLKQ